MRAPRSRDGNIAANSARSARKIQAGDSVAKFLLIVCVLATVAAVLILRKLDKGGKQ